VSGPPRFFCEQCGAEVPRNANRCSSCGRLFSSVLCPSCGFSGAERLFADGCPSCGYSAPAPRRLPSERDLRPAGALPFWVYAVTFASLLAVAAAAVLLFAKP